MLYTPTTHKPHPHTQHHTKYILTYLPYLYVYLIQTMRSRPKLKLESSSCITYTMQILLEFYPLPKVFIHSFTRPSSNFLHSLLLIHSSMLAKYEANELSPLSISSSHSALSKPKDTKRSSITLTHVFFCLPLHVFLSHSLPKNCLGNL